MRTASGWNTCDSLSLHEQQSTMSPLLDGPVLDRLPIQSDCPACLKMLNTCVHQHRSFQTRSKTGCMVCRIGLVLMRSQEGNAVGVSTFGILCVSWILTVIFRPSPCIHCLQASTHIVSKLHYAHVWMLTCHVAYMTFLQHCIQDWNVTCLVLA